MASQRTKLIDLQGHRVVPGLIDGHLHGMRESYHCWTQGVRLDLVTSRAKALQMYAAKADQLPDDKWIFTGSGGWSLTQLDPTTLAAPKPFTFAELTAAMPKNPAWIMGGGVSGPIVNQKTLDVLGLTLPPDGTTSTDGVANNIDGNHTVRLIGTDSAKASAAILAQLDTLG